MEVVDDVTGIEDVHSKEVLEKQYVERLLNKEDVL